MARSTLAEYLRDVATVQMGLDRSPEDDRRAAQALFDRWVQVKPGE